jgi:CheY-like chemotaxis protein
MDGKNILIIDDDLAFSEMLSEILKDEGAIVSVAHDGAQGLEVAEQLKPDLIMCDVMMPRVKGTEVLQTVRSSEWGVNIPFVLLTNMNAPEVLEDIKKDTTVFTDCLLKTDWTLDQIAEKLKEILATT